MESAMSLKMAGCLYRSTYGSMKLSIFIISIPDSFHSGDKKKRKFRIIICYNQTAQLSSSEDTKHELVN